MPKKRKIETSEQQSARFNKAVQDMVDAGELNPIEADAKLDQAMGGVARLRQEWFDGDEDQEALSLEPDQPSD
jgi:hypothetical protein